MGLVFHQITVVAGDAAGVCMAVDNSTWVEQVEEQRDQSHQQRVEDVDVKLLRLQDTIPAHDVLGDTEGGPNEDEETCRVEDVEQLLPWSRNFERLLGWVFVNSEVEDERDSHKKAKEDDLNAQSTDDYILAHLDVVSGLCGGQKCAT